MTRATQDSPLVELMAERPVAGGRMLARLDGQIVFVAGAIPGERVRAAVTRRTGKVSWAETREVLEPSTDRRDAFADPRCGGALFAHIKYERQLQLKAEVVKDAFRRIGKIQLGEDIPVLSSPESAYRLRARLQVQGTRYGFVLEGTHELCDAGATNQLPAESLEAVGHLRETLGPAFGACGSIQVSESVAGRERVAICELRPGADAAPFVGLSLPAGFTGVVVQTEGGMFTAAGEDRLTDTSADLLGTESGPQWTRRAASFFQGNRFLVGPLLDRVMTLASGGTFADLYAGVGLFGVALAHRGGSGFAVEGDEASGEDLSKNALQVEGRMSVRLEPVEVSTTARLRRPLDVVVVDPPRTGLSSAVAEGLIRWAVARIVYVSCDAPTLARDAALFIGGGYRLASLEALDMFPNTAHVECLAVFER
jgi:23S rRNA (uracil1939-C5)-methyltransferase